MFQYFENKISPKKKSKAWKQRAIKSAHIKTLDRKRLSDPLPS